VERAGIVCPFQSHDGSDRVRRYGADGGASAIERGSVLEEWRQIELSCLMIATNDSQLTHGKHTQRVTSASAEDGQFN
jgi:hypothetical protein